MKTFKELSFVADASAMVEWYINCIRNADSYEQGKGAANQAIGYIRCVDTLTNNMLTEENKEFVNDMDDVIEDWNRQVFEAVISKALDTHQSQETISDLCNKRDEAC